MCVHYMYVLFFFISFYFNRFVRLLDAPLRNVRHDEGRIGLTSHEGPRRRTRHRNYTRRYIVATESRLIPLPPAIPVSAISRAYGEALARPRSLGGCARIDAYPEVCNYVGSSALRIREAESSPHSRPRRRRRLSIDLTLENLSPSTANNPSRRITNHELSANCSAV